MHTVRNNAGFVFFELRVDDPKKLVKICKTQYKYCHHGLENQKAYYTLCHKNGKSFYVELVNHPTKGWSYFAETKNKPLFSSLLEKENYYNTAEEAHNTIFKRLNSVFK